MSRFSIIFVHQRGVERVIASDTPLDRSQTEKEIFSAFRNSEQKRIVLDHIEEDLSLLVEQYFPEQHATFKPPKLARYIDSFISSLDKDGERPSDANLTGFLEKHLGALTAAAIIRYVDNFIDESLWPTITEYDPKVIRSLFMSFLQRALITAQFHAPNLPDSIIELPRLELEFTLNPTQEFFDANVEQYIMRKAYDMAVVTSMVRGQTVPQHEPSFKYIAMSIRDVGRDFSDISVGETTTDFNLYEHMKANHIDTSGLDAVLSDIIERYIRAYENDESFDDIPESELNESILSLIKPFSWDQMPRTYKMLSLLDGGEFE